MDFTLHRKMCWNVCNFDRRCADLCGHSRCSPPLELKDGTKKTGLIAFLNLQNCRWQMTRRVKYKRAANQVTFASLKHSEQQQRRSHGDATREARSGDALHWAKHNLQHGGREHSISHSTGKDTKHELSPRPSDPGPLSLRRVSHRRPHSRLDSRCRRWQRAAVSHSSAPAGTGVRTIGQKWEGGRKKNRFKAQVTWDQEGGESFSWCSILRSRSLHYRLKRQRA